MLGINWTIVALTAPVFQDPLGEAVPGSAAGCTTSASPFLDLELCSPSAMNIRPGGNVDLPSAQGASTKDSVFGGVITRLSPSWSDNTAISYAICGDSVTSQWNSDGTITCEQVVNDPSKALNGAFYLVNSSTGAVLFTNPPGVSSNLMSWSTVYNNVYYYMDQNGPNIRRVELNLRNHTITSDAVIATYSGPGTVDALSNGGDGGVTEGDQYWAFFTQGGSATQVCMAKLDGSGTLYCANWYPDLFTFGGNCGTNSPRSAQLFKGPSPSGKQWLLLSSCPPGSNELFSLHPGDAALTDEGPQPLSTDKALDSTLRKAPVFKVQPTTPSDCTGMQCAYSVHEDTVAVNGHQYLFSPGGTNYPSYAEQIFMDPDVAGVANMMVAVEAGGGMYETFTLFNSQDTHTSCAPLKPVCSVDVNDGYTTGNATYLITGLSTGSTTTITSSPNYAGANGDVVVIGGVKGIKGLGTPALCTIGNLNGATFQCSGLTTSGTYTAGGAFTLNSSTCQGGSAICGHLMETILYDATNIESKQFTITRLLKSRAVAMNDHAGAYYNGQPHSSCNAQGTMCAFESNDGIPDYLAVYTYSTGLLPSPHPAVPPRHIAP